MDTEEQASARLAAFAEEIRDLAKQRGVAVIASIGCLAEKDGNEGISVAAVANNEGLAGGSPYWLPS